jgi:PBP1b-binding outer membrane lipoprotein LpoB
MESYRLLPVFFLVLFLSACASTPTKDIEVRSETRPGINLANYNSFAWVASAEIMNDPYGHWEPEGFDADVEVRFLLIKELRDKGLVESSTDPDLLLVFAAGVDMQNLEVVKNSDSKMSSLQKVPKGAFLVALIDSATGRVVWVGVAEGDAEAGRSAEEVKKRLAFAVKKMFADWGNPAE